MNIDELGQKLKVKFPGKFDNLTDEEAGHELIRIAPEYASKLTKPLLKRESFNIPSLNSRVVDYASRIQDLYKPNKGIFSMWWGKIKSRKETEYLGVISEHEKAVIEQGQLLERAVKAKQTEEISFQLFVRQNEHTLLELQAKAILLEEATAQGLTITDFSEVQKLTIIKQLELSLDKARLDLRIIEHEKIREIDYKFDLQEKEDTIRLAILAEHMPEYQKMMLLNGLILNQLEEIDGFEQQYVRGEITKSLMEAKVAAINELISTLKEDIRVRQTRLLQENNG